MRFEYVSYQGEAGSQQFVYLANPVVTNIVGDYYLHGRECNRNGLKLRAPRSYEERHLVGDGMVWLLIPDKNILHRTPLIYDGERLVRHDGSSPEATDDSPAT